MALPPTRRIVTGHNAEGNAIIESDTKISSLDPYSEDGSAPWEDGFGFAGLWRTTAFPANCQAPWEEINGKKISLSDSVGTTVRIVDIPPGVPSFMHRTISMDFGVILQGEVVLELDDGVETTVKEHEVVVQRGTIHAWRNETDKVARMLFVLVPSEPIKVGGEELEATKMPEIDQAMDDWASSSK